MIMTDQENDQYTPIIWKFLLKAKISKKNKEINVWPFLNSTKQKKILVKKIKNLLIILLEVMIYKSIYQTIGVKIGKVVIFSHFVIQLPT